MPTLVRPRVFVGVLVLAGVSLVSQPSAHAARPRLLVELSHRGGADPATRPDREPFEIDITIDTEGAWRTQAASGRLSREALARITRAASRARLTIDRGVYPMCMALPTTTRRVQTRRGALTWLTPCGRRPEPATLALIELVEGLGAGDLEAPAPPEPPPVVEQLPTSDTVLVRYQHNSMEDPFGGSSLVLYVDGRVEGLADGARLSPDDVREVERLSRTAVLGPAPRDQRHECAARLTGDDVFEIPSRGRYTWSTPCGSVHPTIHAILGLIRQRARAR